MLPCIGMHLIMHNSVKIMPVFRFPKEAKTRSAWFKFCGLTEGIDEVSCITICSSHFAPDDFNFPKIGVGGAKILSLKSGAVPSVKNGSKKHKSGASCSAMSKNILPLSSLDELALVNSLQENEIGNLKII